MSVLVVIDHDRGEVAPATWVAMTAARALAGELGVPLEALAIGPHGADLAAAAAEYGAVTTRVAAHDLLADYGPDAWGATVAQVSQDAVVVVAPGTERGNEILANAAARLDEPMVANVLSISPGADAWSIHRVRWGGSLIEETDLVAATKLLTFATTATDAATAPVAVATTEFQPELGAEHATTLVRDRVVLTEGLTLATAPVVVGGGRGVGSAEAYAPLEELAELLGGVVGCSRVATNNGWRPHSDQVGQTGTKIAPKLYIACGISGAIQHWVGAMGSKSVLAINTDREANMVAKADYAVIGDLHEVVPAVVAEIRRRRG